MGPFFFVRNAAGLPRGRPADAGYTKLAQNFWMRSQALVRASVLVA